MKWSYQIYKSGLRVLVCKKNLPHDQLSPKIGEFIVDFHRIGSPDAMVRSVLALDAPNFCVYSRSESGPFEEWSFKISNGYVTRIPLSSDTM